MKKSIAFFALSSMSASTLFAEEALVDKSSLWQTLEPHAVVQVLASSSEREGKRGNDIILDSVELSLAAELDENLSFEIVALYEDGEDFLIDSAEISYSSSFADAGVWGITGGLLYLPFGSYESFFISDPLTLELGEISDGALGIFGEYGAFAASAYVFDGNTDTEDDDLYYAGALSFMPSEWFTLRASVISDICHAGLADNANEVIAENEKFKDRVGFNLSAALRLGDFTMLGEYVGAVDNVKMGEDASRPQAWAVELGYAISEPWQLALRYEGTSEFLPEEMPKSSYGIVTNYQFHENLSVGLEYLHHRYENEKTEDKVTLSFVLEY